MRAAIALSAGVRFVGWVAVVALILRLGAERGGLEPTALGFSLFVGGFVLLLHLVSIRARPWVKRATEPLLAAVVGAGVAFAVFEAPPLGMALLAVALGVRLLVPPAAGARVFRLLRLEWGKWMRGRLLPLGALLAVAAPLLVGFLAQPPENESGWSAWVRLFGTGAWTAEILLLVLGATSLAGEIGQGTMKMVLPHAYRRSDWVLAKALGLGLAALLLVGLAFAAAGAFAATQFGLGDVVRASVSGFGEQTELQIFQSASVMGGYLRDIAWTALASAGATALVGLALSSFFGGSVPTLSLGFLLYLSMRFGDLLLGLPLEAVAWLYPTHPEAMRESAALFGRGINDYWNPALPGIGLSWSALTAALALAVALRVFDRRELA